MTWKARFRSATRSVSRSFAQAIGCEPLIAWSPIQCGIRPSSKRKTTMLMNWIAFRRALAFPAVRPTGAGCDTSSPALSETVRGRGALDTGAASRGSGNANTDKEKDVRRWFVEKDLIEGVIYLPEK